MNGKLVESRLRKLYVNQFYALPMPDHTDQADGQQGVPAVQAQAMNGVAVTSHCFFPPGFRYAIPAPKRIFTKYGLSQPKGHL
jgi:hypothetical protein